MSVLNKQTIVNRTAKIQSDHIPVAVIVAFKSSTLMEEPAMVSYS